MSLQENNLSAIADAIRAKEGSSDPISANKFAEKILNISTGPDTMDATASAEDIRFGESAYVKGKKVIGSAPEVLVPKPAISVSNTGLVTASNSLSEDGYIQLGSNSSSYQLPVQAGKTITPGRSRITACASGRYTTGSIYVDGEVNLTASNIKSGVSIYGITGTYQGEAPEMASCTYNLLSNYKERVFFMGVNGCVIIEPNTSGNADALIGSLLVILTSSTIPETQASGGVKHVLTVGGQGVFYTITGDFDLSQS